MTQAPKPFLVNKLKSGTPTRFACAPEAPARDMIADDLKLLALRKLRFEGDIRAEGKRDWRLSGKLGATVVQACVVTLEPVVTRIEAEVTRLYLAHMPEQAEDEEGFEIPEDDSLEPLGPEIDPGAVMVEALALNLPLYPRAEGADLGEAVFSEPGVAPLTDQAIKPFAGLAQLRARMGKETSDGDDQE